MCHRELWPASLNQPVFYANNSLGLAEHYQKITIPVINLFFKIIVTVQFLKFTDFSLRQTIGMTASDDARYHILVPNVHILTHWGRVTHIFVNKLTIIGSDDGLSSH